MYTKLILTCLTLGALLGSVNGCTEDNDTNRTKPKVYAEDAALTTKIKANLAKSSMASL